MTTPDTYEVEYLALTGQPGMEALRRECGNCAGAGWFADLLPLSPVSANAVPEQAQRWCVYCQGRGWLPLLDAERMGALVRVAAMDTGWRCYLGPNGYEWAATLIGLDPVDGMPGPEWIGDGDSPEAALTRGLLAATEEKA